jgi:hypothetical protein
MSYRGRELTSGNYLKLDDISSQFNGSTTTFNLTSGGNLFYPGSAFSLLVVLGGVVQEPESAYTIDQYQITFASAPGVSDDFFCIVMGVALGIGVPADGTVTTSKLQDGSVTAAKLASNALAGAAGTWAASPVGIHTTKIVGINTTTIVGIAGSEGALQVFGNIAVTDGAVLTDQVVDGMITIPAGKNGLIIGPAAVSLGSTVIVELGSTLVIV